MEGRDVRGMVVDRVGTIVGPSAISMAALVQCQHVKLATHRPCEAVPGMGMSGEPMQQQHRGCWVMAPVQVV
jgi:hypothetical protein